MARERPDIQGPTRTLASKVTKPDEGDWKELKQIILYLKETSDYAQKMRRTSSMTSSIRDMVGQGGPVPGGEEVSVCSGPSLLEIHTDANRAGDRVTRRSSSCATYFLNGNYFFAVTRTQRSVALSSRSRSSLQQFLQLLMGSI